MSRPLRIGLVGATTILGREVAGLLAEQSVLTLSELRAFGSEGSLGEELEFGDDWVEIRTGATDFSGLDLVVLCTSAGAALEEIRQALRLEVPCIDCSGALLDSSDVPLVVPQMHGEDAARAAPLLTNPPGTGLAWVRVLSVLDQEVGVVRVAGSILHSASLQGHDGIGDLSTQTVALLNQEEVPDSLAFAVPVAFDCFPHAEATGDGGQADVGSAEGSLVRSLARLLGPDLKLSVTPVQVPTFAGEGSALWLESRDPIDLEKVRIRLASTSGIRWADEAFQASTRSAVGLEEVVVARLRHDSSAHEPTRSLMLWLSADPVRLAARNVLELVQARFFMA